MAGGTERHEVDATDHRDDQSVRSVHGDRDVDGPLELGVLLAAGEPQREGDGRQDDHELPAPVHEVARREGFDDTVDARCETIAGLAIAERGALLAEGGKGEEAVANLEREMIIDALKNTRGNATAAADLLTATENGYSMGKFGLLTVLDAQGALFEARTLHLDSLEEYALASTELERLIGRTAINNDDTAQGGRLRNEGEGR